MKEIYERCSIRKFIDKPVEEEKIQEILKAGMQAPSARNQQPWEFFVVTDKEMIIKLSQTSPYASCAASAPCIIVPVYHTNDLKCPEYAHIDMAICQENMWLMTTALNLGGVWLGVAPNPERMKAVSKALNLPSHLVPFSLFPIGYEGEEKKQQDRFDTNRIHRI